MAQPHHELLTASRMAAFRTCPRLHYYQYELKVRKLRVDSARSTGSLVHKGLEGWWLNFHHGQEVRLRAARDMISQYSRDRPSDPFDVMKAQAILTAYEVRWGEQEVEVIGAEDVFRVPLVNPITNAASRTFDRGGKTDVKIRHRGRKKVVEHKTTVSYIGPGGDYWVHLRLDSQVSLYLDALKASGFHAHSVLYDVIRKPGLKPLKQTAKPTMTKGKECKPCSKLPQPSLACEVCLGSGWKEESRLHAGQRHADETPAEFYFRYLEALKSDMDKWFARGEVARTQNEWLEARFDEWQTAAEIRAMRKAGVWPRNSRACFNYNRPCDFFAVCTNMTDINDGEKYVHLKTKHPELEKESTE